MKTAEKSHTSLPGKAKHPAVSLPPDATSPPEIAALLSACHDPEALAAAVLVRLNGGTIKDRASVLRDLTSRVKSLTTSDSGERLRVLAAQVPVVELLAQELLVKAAEARSSKAQQSFLTMALSCQKSLVRLIATIDQIAAENRTINP